jgi:hypothetical protein
MPLYESRKHAENRIEVKSEWRDALVLGPDKVVPSIIRLIAERKDRQHPLRLAFDGWYNIDWPAVIAATEYSFFTYDFARPSWDERNTSLTATAPIRACPSRLSAIISSSAPMPTTRASSCTL